MGSPMFHLGTKRTSASEREFQEQFFQTDVYSRDTNERPYADVRVKADAFLSLLPYVCVNLCVSSVTGPLQFYRL